MLDRLPAHERYRLVLCPTCGHDGLLGVASEAATGRPYPICLHPSGPCEQCGRAHELAFCRVAAWPPA